MTINERIKLLRKSELKMTQGDFAEALNLSQSNVSNIEIGRIDVTDRTKKDICAQFNVNPEWLETGEGEIFNPGQNSTAKRILSVMADLPDDYWDVLEDIIDRVSKK